MLSSLRRIFNKSYTPPEHRYKLAILYDENAQLSPSNNSAIRNFLISADRNNLDAEIITKDDFFRLKEFDALFIRDTTYRDHYTLTFAEAAQRLGLVVLDHPNDIINCTDKTIFDRKCLFTDKCNTPKTRIIYRTDPPCIYSNITYPLVIKSPYGCFSQDVFKVDNDKECEEALLKVLATSDKALIQEFLPTEFDWRICILNHEILFVCKYFMAKDDWRILKYKNGLAIEGKHESVAFRNVPIGVLTLAHRIAKLYGNGLYGIDIKYCNGKLYGIECNDSPSIDTFVEDEYYPDVYDKIMKYFKASLMLSRR